MTKSRHVTFRCTEEQYDQICDQAKANGTSVSKFILERACDDNDTPIYLDSESIRKCQDTLNQLRSHRLTVTRIKDKP